MIEVRLRTQKKRVAMVGVLVASLGLQACGVTASKPRNEAGDLCVPARAPLAKAVDDYNEKILVNAGGGAVLGGAAGGGIAAASGGNTGQIIAGILVGAAIGALAGAFKGYYENKQKQARNNAELKAAVRQDIRAARNDMNSVSGTISQLNQCRLRQIENLRQRVNRGERGPQIAEALRDVRRRMDQDQQLIAHVVGEFDKGREVFSKAYAESHQVDEQSSTPVAVRYTPQTKGGPATPGLTGNTAYTQKATNVRSGPGTSNAKIGRVSAGSRVLVLSGTPGAKQWVKVSYGGGTAFIYGPLLGKARPTNATPSKLPRIDENSRPKSANDNDELLMEAKEMKAESGAQKAVLSAELDAIDALMK